MDNAESAPRVRSPWVDPVWASFFALLGLLGNYITLPLGFNVNFIFGSIFGLLAVSLLGPGWGITASAVAASYSFVLWNHPYAIAIFVCESLWVSLALRRKAGSTLYLIDLTYWLFLGIPLVFLFYYGVMDLGLRNAGIIALKQSLNGVCNAVIAGALLYAIPFHNKLDLPKLPLRRSSQIFIEAMALILVIPGIIGLALMNHRDIEATQTRIATQALHSCRQGSRLVSQWIERHLLATAHIALAGEKNGFSQSTPLQAEISKIRTMFPDFHNVFVANASGVTVGFDPPLNARSESTIGLDFSDREYFSAIKTTKRPFVSDIFMGRGGVFTPIFTISSPIFADGVFKGFGHGAINLERMQQFLTSIDPGTNLFLTLIDRKKNIIVSTRPKQTPLQPFSFDLSHARATSMEGVFLDLPPLQKNISLMSAWKDASFVSPAPIEETGWTLIAEAPLAPLQQEIYDSSILNLSVLYILLFLTNGISIWFSGRLTRPVRQLAQLTMSIPERIESDLPLEWPHSEARETAILSENFRQTALVLREKIMALKEAKEVLETKVQERTAELQTSNDKLRNFTKHLEDRVAEEIATRARHEHLLIQQSKMAAMGEMLGAIGHQWRQPLNGLAVIVQNIADANEFGKLDTPFLNKSVEQAMTQIKHMSRTIDSFRDFFKPEKQKERFNLFEATTTVLQLFSAQLKAEGIAFRLDCTALEKSFEDMHAKDCCGGHIAFGYRNEFEQVLANLVNNARQAILERRQRSKEATPGLIAFTFATNQRITLTISDNGGGIDPAILPKIFDPYFTTKGAKGTGLGLYIAKVIVEDHMEGTIHVSNAVDGAALVIELPLAEGDTRG